MCPSRPRGPCEVSFTSYGFPESFDHKKMTALISSVSKVVIVP